MLVQTNASDPFDTYYAEILRGEGLNEFDVADAPITSADAGGHTTVILARLDARPTPRSRTLTAWVQTGGNLIAMRPDKKLAPLLGLTDTAGTLADGYLKVDPNSAAGAGIDPETLQFHGTADRYTLSGASAVAGLYSDATTATPSPAVTLRDVGASGGQVAAFTYDLARSVVYTRQGNPAWAGEKRDGWAPPDPAGRPLLRRQGRRRAARLGRPQPVRRAAGRRAAAPAREPDHGDEPRQGAAAAVLVPAERRQGGASS